jgi:GAF domain-containing protein
MADDAREQAEDLAEMALRLHDEETLEGRIHRVLEFAVRELDCSYAAVVFARARHRLEVVAATDEVVGDLDEVQMASGAGPDLQVIGSGAGVVVHDTTDDARWPEWVGAASRAGVRSMLAAPLRTAEQTLGSLDLYDLRPGHFDEDDLEVAEVLARHAAVALDAARSQNNLWRAIGSRHLIGMAQGILMERFSIDADEAFAVLRRYSQDGNVKLRVVAESVVRSRRSPEAG